MRPKKSNALPKYVFAKQKTLQHPKGVLYFERRGWPSVKFKTQDPTAPEFWVEYAAFMSDGYRPAAKTVTQQNFTALVDSYVRSKRYRKLAPATAHDYDKVLSFFKTSFGNLKPRDMKRTHVIQMRDSNSDRYRFANYLVQVGSVLFEHAIDLGWVDHNPAKGAGLLERVGPARQPWPQHLIKAFRKAADHRTLLVFELALSSGQRIQDVLDFRWSDLSDGGIDLVQNKTGKSLWVPLSSEALTLLNRTKKEGMTIITTSKRYGHRPLAYRSAQQQIQSVREKIGAMDYDIHSLRYSAACQLAEAGCSDEEIGSITGQTVQTVQHYTKSVRQKANALVAMKARERMLNRNTK